MATRTGTRKALKKAGARRKKTTRPSGAQNSAKRGARSTKKARVASIAKPAGRRAKKNTRRVVMKWKKPAKRRANGATAAKAMFEKFHGKPSTKAIDYKAAQHFHAHLAKLGDLNHLKVIMPEDFHMEAVELKLKGVSVACSEDGGQIYFVGGDQKIDLAKLGLASQLPKDHVVIGPVFEIEYRTEKKFDGFKDLNYYHAFGEEGGEMPTLCYDVRSGLLYLVGGSYQCEAPGIVD